MLRDEVPEAFEAVGIEDGGLAAAVRPRFDRISLTAELEQSGDGRDIDAEPFGDLAS